jgi:segregation and condensation protein B
MTDTLTPETEEAVPERPREKRAEKILPALEALLFSSSRPVKARDLADVLEATPAAVEEALALLAADAERPQRGVRLEGVAGGWRFVTHPEFDGLLRKFHEVSERSRLSLAALETLAIIAYRQPITLPEVQEIRGVNSSSVLNTLFEKKLITTAGRKSVVGSPFLYRTTPEFLVRFGLKDVDDLPHPQELAEDLAATAGEAPLEGLPEAVSAAAIGQAEDEEEEFDDDDEDDEDDDDEDGSDDADLGEEPEPKKEDRES